MQKKVEKEPKTKEDWRLDNGLSLRQQAQLHQTAASLSKSTLLEKAKSYINKN